MEKIYKVTEKNVKDVSEDIFYEVEKEQLDLNADKMFVIDSEDDLNKAFEAHDKLLEEEGYFKSE